VHISLYRNDISFYYSVKDKGIGISKDKLPKIFDRFYRADESRTKETGGYGLGLSIARIVVQGHHGSITVKSKEGAGSTFTIQIPLRHQENDFS
jgi:signal transduction histidine kinase